MTFRDEQDVVKGARPLSRRAEDSRIGRVGLLSPLEPWKWLEELRVRFDLAFEVLDTDLQFVLPAAPYGSRGGDIRGVIGDAPVLRDAAAAALRTGKIRSVTVGTLRLRISPLFGTAGFPRTVVGLLMIADALSAGLDTGSDPAQESDRRLEAAGQWLAAAIEAAIKTADADAIESHRTQRLAAMIDIVQTLNQMDDERQLIRLIVDAIALWFDVDIRVYRLGSSGTFTLDTWLPGARESDAPIEIPLASIWGHQDVFAVDSLHGGEALNWPPRLADALFVPIVVDDSPEWLLMVFGASDPSLRAMLAFLGRSAGLCVARQTHAAREHLLQKMGAVLTMGDPPFEAVVRLALEAAALELGATASRLAVYYRDVRVPAFTIGWGRADSEHPAFVEPGVMTSTDHEVIVGASAGAGVTAVLEFHRLDAGLSAATARLAPLAASTLASWLAGVFLRYGGEGQLPAPSASSSDLLKAVDRAGRLHTGGAVAAVLLDLPAASRPNLGELVKVLEDQVRSSDVVGLLAERGAGVLLSDVAPANAAAVAERLSRAAKGRFNVAVTAGAATIGPSPESAEAVIARAVSNARRSGASS